MDTEIAFIEVLIMYLAYPILYDFEIILIVG
jgi:hypothetical protein